MRVGSPRDLVLSGTRTGVWWLVLLVPALLFVAMVVTATKVVAPTAVYVFM